MPPARCRDVELLGHIHICHASSYRPKADGYNCEHATSVTHIQRGLWKCYGLGDMAVGAELRNPGVGRMLGLCRVLPDRCLVQDGRSTGKDD